VVVVVVVVEVPVVVVEVVVDGAGALLSVYNPKGPLYELPLVPAKASSNAAIRPFPETIGKATITMLS
jgi:hypothetical protein